MNEFLDSGDGYVGHSVDDFYAIVGIIFQPNSVYYVPEGPRNASRLSNDFSHVLIGNTNLDDGLFGSFDFVQFQLKVVYFFECWPGYHSFGWRRLLVGQYI